MRLKKIKVFLLSLYALAQKAGLCYAPVFHFASGQRSLTLPTAGKLADALGLELVQKTKPKKTVKKRK
jgi:plasmid maintenance system antidote protein VapI